MRNLVLSLILLFTVSTYAQTEVTFYTNYGDFTIELHDSLMPITTGNFIGLVNSKGYDGKTFYRVVANFVIQGGYRTGLPPAIQDEFDSTGTLSNKRWTLSMANSGPNSGSSEIFINLKDNLFLDYDKAPLTSAHPIFGTVKSGYAEVLTIGNVAVDGNDQPLIPVVMDSVRVTTSGLSDKQIRLNSERSAIYPNPISPESVLDLYSTSGGIADLQLLDISGKLLYEAKLEVGSGKNIIPLHVMGLSNNVSGVYFLQVSLKEGDQVFRIQKD